MQTIYQYSENWVYTGKSTEISDKAGAPLGWTRVPPPDVIPPGKFAVFTGIEAILVERPPPAPPAPVPDTVTKRQFVQQLIAEDLYDAVVTILDAIPDPVERQLMWSWFRDSNEFERHRPELIQIAEKLEKSEQEIDEFFRRADAR